MAPTVTVVLYNTEYLSLGIFNLKKVANKIKFPSTYKNKEKVI
jgi:hypothetical protein